MNYKLLYEFFLNYFFLKGNKRIGVQSCSYAHLPIGILLLCSSHYTACSEFNCQKIYNAYDVTEGIQNAINSGADKIIIPFMGNGSKWISSPLSMISKKNIEIFLEPGVILESKSGGFTDKLVSFITLTDCSNIKIIGFDAEIRMLKHEYTDKGEWRHAFSILSSDSIEIQGLKISKTGGDAVYVGTNEGAKNYSSNIVLRSITADRNARNGISVISCRNLLIEDCEIYNTGIDNNKNNAAGGPWAGIDLEPNYEHEILENITINNCLLENNRGAGLAFAFGGNINTITISNNEIRNNWSGINLLGKLRGESGNILIKSNNISGNQHYGMYIVNWNRTPIHVEVEDCTFDLERIFIPVKFEISSEDNSGLTYGNVSFINVHFHHAKNTCMVYLEGADSIKYFEDISLSRTTINYNYGNSWDYTSDMLLNSSYSVNSFEGDPIFCNVEKNQLSISIKPNPSADLFLFQCNTFNIIDLQIYDTAGRLVLSEFIKNDDFVYCRSLSTGQYIIIAKDIVNQRVASNKLIKL